MTALRSAIESQVLDPSEVALSISVPAKSAVPRPKAPSFAAGDIPLNVRLSVALEENGRLKSEMKKLRDINAAQATELDIFRAKLKEKQVTVDG